VGQARIAGLAALAGSCAAVAGTYLPWIQATDPSDGITLTKAGIEGHYGMLVAALAVISACGSAFLLARRSRAVAIAIVLLGLLQLGIVIFVARNLSAGVVQLEALDANAGLGPGIYIAGLGSIGAVIAAAVAYLGLKRDAALARSL
jgi:hypothetical protein